MEPINRKLLKENAKRALKRNFWMIMLVCFCAQFLGAGFNGLNAGANVGGKINKNVSGLLKKSSLLASFDNTDLFSDLNEYSFDDYFNEDEFDDNFEEDFQDDLENAIDDFEEAFYDFMESFEDMDVTQAICTVVAIICVVFLLTYLIAITIAFLIGSFLGAPVNVGYRRYFMLNRFGTARFSDLFAAFGQGRYMKIVKTMFKTNFEIFLWRLLFYFPGVVKLYQYYFVSYIMAENPNIDPKRAKEISKEMTNGHKWQIFVLELSFIGWALVFVAEIMLLSIVSCGVLAIPGVLLMYPLVGYQMTTYAELYEERREYALMTGIASKDELVGFDFGA